MKTIPVQTRHFLGCCLLCLATFLLTACNKAGKARTDQLNELSYIFHYRNLDSTLYYAEQSIIAAQKCSYDGGYAEALNNKAFVSIARMQYDQAFRQLDSVAASTDDQIELLVSDIQYMRLCQRMSKNKDFYNYRENALQRLKRIEEEEHTLDQHQRMRMTYARSELNIVTSTYYYYIGLEEPSIQAILNINPDGEIKADTAQWLNYLYNVGAGGIVTQGSQEEINQIEMDHLFQCYSMSVQYGYIFWTANSLQAISEHLQTPKYRDRLIADNWSSFTILDVDNVPDSLLAGSLAQRSLDMFSEYGDVYQTAGAYRTLAQCYWTINDYNSSLEYLNEALSNDSAIFQAPDLVASIREQLSVVYAAIDDHAASDYNRKLYLEKQDQTRQDRYFESRAEQLRHSVNQLNGMIGAIIVLMIVGLLLLFFFSYWRKRDSKKNELDQLLLPLEKWKHDNEQYAEQLNDQYEEAEEKKNVAYIRLQKNKRFNLEQRAKISIVNGVTPFIDRILHEISRLRNLHESEEVRQERYQYIAELSDRINDHNVMLTQWIQLRQGELSLHIESFPLQPLFDIVSHARMGFVMKNIHLTIKPTDLWVKADRTLTLFMINTIADNARKFTPENGTVTIEALEADKYVEIAISDNGMGMTQEQIEKAFSVEKKAVADEALQKNTGAVTERSHGFGLVNCKGIIEKYKKVSSLFNVCDISVQSKVGEGSRFAFRLPRGIARALMLLVAVCGSLTVGAAPVEDVSEALLRQAELYADSTVVSNRRNDYHATLQYADSAIRYLNKNYRLNRPNAKDTLVSVSGKSVLLPEVNWYHDKIDMDYQVILTVRNESAVAALALHQWDIYRYNNKVYTQLFKEMSADNTLEDYCRVMQESQSNKMVAIIILVILAILILLAYFLLYYRHHVYYRFCIEKVRDVNQILLSEQTDERKLQQIERIAQLDSRSGGAKKKPVGYDDERLPVPLQSIVDQILQTLRKNMAFNQQQKSKISLVEDEVRKVHFEDSRLHVCNSVLDNCLSTLKHETMYYPSRIRMLVNGGDDNLEITHETASYYKELYTVLSAQAMRQVRSVEPECKPVRLGSLDLSLRNQDDKDIYVLGDPVMIDYLFEILKKQAGVRKLEVENVKKHDGYVSICIALPHISLTEQECLDLFNPTMDNLPYLLCRQIIRDAGEVSNSRGCGMIAEKADKGIRIRVTMAQARKSEPRTANP